MDLLDSILKGMEGPPTIKQPEIKDKAKREKFEKMQKERQEMNRKRKLCLDEFRVNMSKTIKSFVNRPTTDDPKTYMLKLEPLSKVFRSIIREVCEDYEQELVVYSFGTEEVDRHCVIWRKGFEPCEDEIRHMKLGVEYKPKNEEEEDNDDDKAGPSGSGTTAEGKDKFWEKYEKIIGENASGLESARVALPAKQYGCVPIENKKDQRSIEQMIDDIRKTKKQKTSDEPATEEETKSVHERDTGEKDQSKDGQVRDEEGGEDSDQ